MDKGIQEWTKSNFWKAAFKKFEVILQIFRGCLSQIFLGLFLNTLTQMMLTGTGRLEVLYSLNENAESKR